MQAKAVAEVHKETRQLRSVVEDLQTTVEAIDARTRGPTQDIIELSSDVSQVRAPMCFYCRKVEPLGHDP